MMKRLAMIFALAGLLALTGGVARADSLDFALSLSPPAGAVSGPPGSTVGWGYTVTNNSLSSWLVLGSVSADPFQHGIADASVFLFSAPSAIAPGASLTVASLAGISGLFEFTWDANAPVGFTNVGTFIVTGEFYDNDPLNGGMFIALSPDGSVAYSATATAPANAAVPEPATLVLLVTGLAAIGLRRRSAAQKD